MAFHLMWPTTIWNMVLIVFFLWAPTKYHCRSSTQVRADGAHGADDDDDVGHEPQNVCSGLRKDATLHRRQHKHYSFHNYLTCGREIKRKNSFRKAQLRGTNHSRCAKPVLNTPIEELFTLRRLYGAHRTRVFYGDFLFAMRLSLRSTGKWCRRLYSSPLTDGDADGYCVV